MSNNNRNKKNGNQPNVTNIPNKGQAIVQDEKEKKNIVKKFFSKLFNVFSSLKHSRKLKKLRKKIEQETIDPNVIIPRLKSMDDIPFLYFGSIKSHQIYQLYKYIEITNLVRNIDFMEKWIVNSSLRKSYYDIISEMNEEYLLQSGNGNKNSNGGVYSDNIRPDYRDKAYNLLKTQVKSLATTVQIECRYGTLVFEDAVWDCLGCMVFKHFMGLDVQSPLVCHIDHIFPFSRIKGGASELQNLCVLNQSSNSYGRKGKNHLFELYTDSEVDALLKDCIRESHLIAIYNTFYKQNTQQRKQQLQQQKQQQKQYNNSNKKATVAELTNAILKRELGEVTRQFLINQNIGANHIGDVNVEEDKNATKSNSNSTFIISVKFISNPQNQNQNQKKKK